MERGTIFRSFGKYYVKLDGCSVKFETYEEAERFVNEEMIPNDVYYSEYC